MTEKKPAVAAALSLIPGLGQMYVGKTKKGVALLCIDAGLMVPLFFFPSRLTWVLAGGVYMMTMIPAGLESCLIAKTGHSSPIMNSKKYIVLLLLMTGINAVPLLWQNQQFSRRAKILWTIAVPLLAVLFFGAVWQWGAKNLLSTP